MTATRPFQAVRRVSSWLVSALGGRGDDRPADPCAGIAAVETGEVPTPSELFRRTGTTAEEYIVALLGANDGKMRQSEIVAETGWAKSTVSSQLAELERRGAVDRVPIGREKLVYLPGAQPEAAKRPFEGRRGAPQVASTR